MGAAVIGELPFFLLKFRPNFEACLCHKSIFHNVIWRIAKCQLDRRIINRKAEFSAFPAPTHYSLPIFQVCLPIFRWA